MSSLWMLNNL